MPLRKLVFLEHLCEQQRKPSMAAHHLHLVSPTAAHEPIIPVDIA